MTEDNIIPVGRGHFLREGAVKKKKRFPYENRFSLSLILH